MYQPLHLKYRPKNLQELVGQDTIKTTLTNAITSDKIAQAYLFTGPRGTGKTSTARIQAKSLNCLNSKKPTATPCGECSSCKTIDSCSTTVRTVFYEGSGEESYPGLKVQSDSKKDCAMDSLQNILTDALTTVGHFTNRNEPSSSHS